MGLQFFKNCLGLLPFGMQEIIPNLWETGSSVFKNIQLIAFIISNFKSFKKNFKNSTVKPPRPGDLLFSCSLVPQELLFQKPFYYLINKLYFNFITLPKKFNPEGQGSNKRPKGLNGYPSIKDSTLTSCQKSLYLHISCPMIE